MNIQQERVSIQLICDFIYTDSDKGTDIYVYSV